MQFTSILSYAIVLLAQSSNSMVAANAVPELTYGQPPNHAKPRSQPLKCPADKCFASIKLSPPLAKVASTFCSKYITRAGTTVTRTSTSTSIFTAISTSTATATQVTSQTTVTIIPEPATVSPACTTSVSTVEGVFTTSVFFTSQGNPPDGAAQKRALPTIPTVLGYGCGTGKSLQSKVSSACSCYLGPARTCTTISKPVVRTTTTRVVITTITAQTTTITATTTNAAVTVTECHTATSVTTTFAGGARTCGAAPPASAYTTGGRISCTAPAPAGETNARFRIEAFSDTIFDGCIISGPRNITTPSGGTHLCDGTNNNANPVPGSTFTTDIDSAGRQNGFDYDGTYSNQFADFFINRISTTMTNGNQFWGVLRNRVFTARGGCQEQNAPGDEALWAFDAFAPNRVFLDLDSQYAVVQPGQQVTIVIVAGDPNSGNTIPAQGAVIVGQTADANGQVTFQAPQKEGCYQYKATRDNAVNSQTFYLTVAASF